VGDPGISEAPGRRSRFWGDNGGVARLDNPECCRSACVEDGDKGDWPAPAFEGSDGPRNGLPAFASSSKFMTCARGDFAEVASRTGSRV